MSDQQKRRQRLNPKQKSGKQQSPDPSSGKQVSAFYKYTGIATKMALIIVAGTFGGLQLDQYLGLSFPVFTMVLVLVSVGLAMYVVIRDISK